MIIVLKVTTMDLMVVFMMDKLNFISLFHQKTFEEICQLVGCSDVLEVLQAGVEIVLVESAHFLQVRSVEIHALPHIAILDFYLR